MSGVEVVGVVLGAIPLVISALDYYKVTKQSFRSIRNKDILLDQLIESLKEQRFFFQTDICLALKKTNLEVKQIMAMINDSGLSRFDNPEIAEALQEYLGEGATLYINAITRCEAILGDIVANTSGLISSSQWSQGTLSKLIQDQPRKNGKFESTKRLKFGVRIEELKQQIRSLEESTRSLSRLRDVSAKRQQITSKAMSKTVTRFTTALSTVQSYAQALLFLQTRSSAMDTKKPKKPPIRFTMSFYLCQFVQRAHENGMSVQLYLSRSGKFSYLNPPFGPDLSDRKANDEAFNGTITLKEVFSLMQKQGSAVSKLEVYEKMALAFNITSSILQLHSTPWLQAPLTSSSIRFVSDSSMFFHLAQPFIVSTFPDQGLITSPCTAKASMLELGIILLEIWHVKSLEQYALEIGRKMDNTYGARYEIAKVWLDSSDDIMLPFFLELVTRCVECTFATTSAALKWVDPMFRKSVCEYVLRPLWENCPRSLR
ncbi:uncharacterized protein BO97DRAFT_430582 [Aspergillus homomorphus CBS 101889]|uniref:DUF7580 domain-containing protein n=1 Tax=Aspergillus homomorphus (strain CBS 101889) TaxID=1450537 RepID=A0A395ICR9_ASPHC|nr:hypothetical protein BO97DRAFT_430582 [Aspergillus homomorphus CBS 101889]RAL17609.1 hypothetical protein BO97DRAFT_430582 [Aspergillus homomorphus CBS 101889]